MDTAREVSLQADADLQRQPRRLRLPPQRPARGYARVPCRQRAAADPLGVVPGAQRHIRACNQAGVGWGAGDSAVGVFSEYAALLGQYTSREMTNSGGLLSAVLGLLKVLERMAGGTRGTMADRDAEREEMAHSERPRISLGSPDTVAPLPSHLALDPTLGTARESAGPGHSLYGLPKRFLDLELLWQPPAAEDVYLTNRVHDNLVRIMRFWRS